MIFSNIFQAHFKMINAIRCVSTQRIFSERQDGKVNWSYVRGPNRGPLLKLTVGQLLQKAADSHGDETAAVFVHQNIRKSFHQTLAEADQVAAALLSLNLKRGDRIGMWGPNSYEWLLILWAAARAGLILVSINPAYKASELQHAMNLTGVKTLILAETFRNQNLADILIGITQCGNQLDAVLPSLENVVVISDKKSIPGALRWSDLLDRATPRLTSQIHNMQRQIQCEEPVNIQFTSGTTGNPKGATLSHQSVINAANSIGRTLGYHERAHRLCLPLPLYHIFASGGVVASAVHPGTCLVFPSPTWAASETVKAIQKEKCSVLYGTPTMFGDILNLPDLREYDVSSLETTLMAGAPCPVHLAKSVVDNLKIKYFVIGYGLTETSSISFMTKRSDDLETACSTIGYVSDNFEIKIVDPISGETKPINTPGEIWARGYGNMLGYWNQPDKTAETITEEGWLKTGDIGIMNEDGCGMIVGRIKEMIIRGGENIFPREIEDLLHTYPGVQEAQVIGVPDARLGEELCAWIRRKPGNDSNKLTEMELKSFCHERIAYFKVPRYWRFKDSFPTTPTSKVQKFVMKDITIKELGLLS